MSCLKKYILYLSLVCLLINIFSSQALANENNEKELTISQSVYGKYEESALSILAHSNRYSQLSDNEKQTLCKFFGIEMSIMEKADGKGYALRDAIDLAVAISNYKYNLKKYEKEFILSNTENTVINSVYGEPANDQTVIDSVYGDKTQQYGITLSDEDIVQIIEYVSKGYKFKDVTNAWEISKLLGMDMPQIIRKGSNDKISKTVLKNNFDEKEMEAIQQLADKFFWI